MTNSFIRTGHISMYDWSSLERRMCIWTLRQEETMFDNYKGIKGTILLTNIKMTIMIKTTSTTMINMTSMRIIWYCYSYFYYSQQYLIFALDPVIVFVSVLVCWNNFVVSLLVCLEDLSLLLFQLLSLLCVVSWDTKIHNSSIEKMRDS